MNIRYLVCLMVVFPLWACHSSKSISPDSAETTIKLKIDKHSNRVIGDDGKIRFSQLVQDRNEFFLFVEPGCGKYKLLQKKQDAHGVFYQVTECLGAPVDLNGNLITGNESIVGKMIFVEKK